MLVKNWMSTPAVTIPVHSSMQEAMTLMKTHKISLLPVMDQTRLVGVVTEQNLKQASSSEITSLEIHELLYLLSTVQIKDVMMPDPVTVPADFTVEETAELLMDKNVPGVPVMDKHGGVIGVITQSDIFKVMVALAGFKKKGVQFAFRLEDRSGSIREVADIVREFGGRISSILTMYEEAPEGYRNVYIRMFRTDRLELETMVTALKNKFRLLYIVDHYNNRRQIYEA